MDLRRFTWLCLMLCLSVCERAMAGEEGTCGGRYRTVQGLSKDRLKTALSKLIQPCMVLEYGGKGEGYTWAGFAQTDVREDGNVLDRYSNRTFRFNGINAVSGMNIEHSFANSWWGHTVNNAYCDLFNLYPSDSEANGRKSNNPIGVVDRAVAYDNGVTKVGKSTCYRADSLITVWEPADQWKGDFARAYFYMATCYEDYGPLWQTTEGLLMCSNTTWPTLRPWVTKLLLEWNADDPVDDTELRRNAAVESIQGNRNPFVDFPQLAEYIWGDSIGYSFYIDKEATEPELFVPEDGQTIDLGLQALSKGVDAAIVVRGRNLTGDVLLSADGDGFTLSHSVVAAADVLHGTDVTVSCHPRQAGLYSCTLSIVGGGLQHQCHVKAEMVDGIPAYDATDVLCTVASKRFRASWMDMGQGMVYTVNVYTADGKSVNGFPVETTETSLVVNGLKASTTYFYEVSAAGMGSNVVKVVMPAVQPVFSAGISEMAFTSTPGVPSQPQMLNITAIEVPRYETSVEVTEPFEASADGEQWTQSLMLKGSSQKLYVRLGAVGSEGHAEGELLLSTPGVKEIVIALSAEVDASKAFFESFEIGSKGGYAAGTVTCAAATWVMENALIGSDAGDNKNGSKSVRMKVVKNNDGSYSTVLQMAEDKAHGCDSLWFHAGGYNKDATGTLTVSYSMDGGDTWIPVMTEEKMAAGAWKRYGFGIKANGFIRLRFEGRGANGKRINVDDVQMSDFVPVDAVSGAAAPAGVVGVYTPGGILLRTAPGSEALKGLPRGCYIVK